MWPADPHVLRVVELAQTNDVIEVVQLFLQEVRPRAHGAEDDEQASVIEVELRFGFEEFRQKHRDAARLLLLSAVARPANAVCLWPKIGWPLALRYCVVLAASLAEVLSTLEVEIHMLFQAAPRAALARGMNLYFEFSVYNYHVKKLKREYPEAVEANSFLQWLERGGIGSAETSMRSFVVDDKAQQIVDFIGRYLNSDWKKALETIGLEAPELPHLDTTRTSHGPVYDAIGSEEMNLLRATDVEYFGYTTHVEERFRAAQQKSSKER